MIPEVREIAIRRVVGARRRAAQEVETRCLNAAGVHARAVGALSGCDLAEIAIPRRRRDEEGIEIEVSRAVNPPITSHVRNLRCTSGGARRRPLFVILKGSVITTENRFGAGRSLVGSRSSAPSFPSQEGSEKPFRESDNPSRPPAPVSAAVKRLLQASQSLCEYKIIRGRERHGSLPLACADLAFAIQDGRVKSEPLPGTAPRYGQSVVALTRHS